MDIVAFIALAALSGLIVGGLARLAVPRPDPLSVWRTIALGIVGSLLGGLVAGVLDIDGAGGVFLFSLIGAVVLLILYRRVFQGRGITGPGSKLR